MLLIISIIIVSFLCSSSELSSSLQPSQSSKFLSLAVLTLGDGKLVMTGFSSDEIPVWYKFVNRNPSSFYRHEFIYRWKRDGKHRKFVRKNLRRDLSGYLASTPAKSPLVWTWIPCYLQTSCWALENEAFPFIFAHRIQLQLNFSFWSTDFNSSTSAPSCFALFETKEPKTSWRGTKSCLVEKGIQKLDRRTI